MLDQLFRALVVIPFFAVPIALLGWAVFHIVVKGAVIKAIIGLMVGVALCFAAFLLFFMNIYCENCADRPVSLQEAVAVIAYLMFGLVMLFALWWTSIRRGRAQPTHSEKTID